LQKPLDFSVVIHRVVMNGAEREPASTQTSRAQEGGKFVCLGLLLCVLLQCMLLLCIHCC